MVVLVPTIHPRPEMVGNTADRSPTTVVPPTEAVNSLSMSERAVKVEPGCAWPRAARQASRAEVPVPHGERSILPLSTVAPRSSPAEGSSSPVTMT